MNSVDIIVVEAARIRNVHVRDILSKNRTTRIVRARHECMYLARTLTSASFLNIGRALNRDHATVVHGCNSVEQRILDVVGYGDDIEAIGAAIEPKLSPLDLQPLTRPTAAAKLELFIEDRLAAFREQIDAVCERLTTIEKRPTPPPMVILGDRNAGLPAPVLRALAQYEQDRFGARERYALTHLIDTLTGTRSATRGDA